MFRPSFSKGSLLKQNMLESLRDFPLTLLDVEYSYYGNGIVSGFDIEVTDDDMFIISPGIIKINDEIYVSSNNLYIEQKSEKHYVYLFLDKTINSDGIDIELKCVQNNSEDGEGFELFRYTKNAKMYKYKDVFEVLNAPMNRINQSFCKYAIVGGNTLHPDYYRLFAKEILNNSNAKVRDVAFAYQCLNGINCVDVVKQYFGEEKSNYDILIEIKNIIDRLKKDTTLDEIIPEKREGPKKMVIS